MSYNNLCIYDDQMIEIQSNNSTNKDKAVVEVHVPASAMTCSDFFNCYDRSTFENQRALSAKRIKREILQKTVVVDTKHFCRK